MSDTARLGLKWTPPDTIGAIGPDHFVELVNGGVAIFSRTGSVLSLVTDQSFFRVVVGDKTYPRNGSYDPRILYDRRSGRWIASELEFGDTYNAAGDRHENHLLVAISQTSDPTGSWNKYVFYIGLPDAAGVHYFSDYETLGTDDNGVYWGVRYFPSTGSSFVALFATRKAPLLAGSPAGDTYRISGGMAVDGTPHPATNYSAVDPSGLAWFAASSSLDYSGLWLRSLSWPVTGGPVWGAQQVITTPAFGVPPDAPASGSSAFIHTGGVRLQSAVIMENRLWSCRTVGTNYVGGATGVDRSGVEYLVADVSSTAASLIQSGRQYDKFYYQPTHYFYPSICPTGSGSAIMGFSSSNASHYVSSVTCGRLAADAAGTLQEVAVLRDGLTSYTQLDAYGRNRWGDYSYTSLDPRNNQAVWTIQEHASSPANTWGTSITKVGGLTPTITSVTGSLLRGTTGCKLQVQGGHFYDPGPEFPDRLGAYLSANVAVVGTRVTGVTFGSEAYMGLTVDVAADATLGPRSLYIVNPDRQQVAYSIPVRAPSRLALASNGGQRGQAITAVATLLEGDTGAAAGGQTISIYLDDVVVGTGVTDNLGVARVSFKIPEAATTNSVFRAGFAENSTYLGSTATARWTVRSNTTGLYVAAPAATAAGAYVRIYAYLKRTIDNKMLSDRSVTFTFAGVTAGSATTNSNGYCEVLYQIPASCTPGTSAIGAAFAGDNINLACTGGGVATVNSGKATAAYLNPTAGGWGTTVTLYTYLYQSSPKVMLGGQTVQFLVDGVQLGSATTDASGHASLAYKIPSSSIAGTHTTIVRYMGDASYGACSRTSTMTVTGRYGSVLSVLSARGANRLSVPIRAYLYRALDGAPLAQRTVTFAIDKVVVGTATTSAAGLAQLDYTVPAGTLAGSHSVVASFIGDDVTDPSTGASTLATSVLDTLVVVIPNQTAQRGAYVVLYFYAKSATTGQIVPGLRCALALDGAILATVTTDSTGYGGLQYRVPLAAQVGIHTTQVQFPGDTTYSAGTWSSTLTVK